MYEIYERNKLWSGAELIYTAGFLISSQGKGIIRTFWLMGDSFLRAYYSIYDMDNARIGLVGRANNTSKRLTFLNGGTFSDTV